MEDIKQIKVEGELVGIIGFNQIMESVRNEHANEDDETLRKSLLEKFSKKNYIASSSREAYSKAFLREYKKFAGLPCEEDDTGGIDIKVLGPGCAACDNLMSLLMSILAELDLPANLEHMKDVREIGKYGVLGTPALVINGKVRAVGKLPPRKTVKQWLQALT